VKIRLKFIGLKGGLKQKGGLKRLGGLKGFGLKASLQRPTIKKPRGLRGLKKGF